MLFIGGISRALQRSRHILKKNKFYGQNRAALLPENLSPFDIQKAEEYLFFLKPKNKFIGWLREKIQIFALFLFKKFYKVECVDTEYVPTLGAFFLCSNHCSHLDIMSLMAALQRAPSDFVFLAAKDYFFDNKIRNFFVTLLCNIIPFDRSGLKNALFKSIYYVKRCQENGKVIVFFPEGTRSQRGVVQPFKAGVGFLSAMLKLVVVPACIKGTYDCFPKGRIMPKIGAITVRFGHVLDCPEEGNHEDYRIFSTKLEQIVRGLSYGIREEAY